MYDAATGIEQSTGCESIVSGRPLLLAPPSTRLHELGGHIGGRGLQMVHLTTIEVSCSQRCHVGVAPVLAPRGQQLPQIRYRVSLDPDALVAAEDGSTCRIGSLDQRTHDR